MLKGCFQEGQRQHPSSHLHLPQRQSRADSTSSLQQQQQQGVRKEQEQQKQEQQQRQERRRVVLQLSDAAGVTKGALKNLLQFIHTDDCPLFSATSAPAPSLSSSSYSASAVSSTSFSPFGEAAEGQEEARATTKEKEEKDAKLKNLLELLIAADLYDVQSAYDRCVEEVISQLSTKNFSSVLLCASRISCKPLIKAARQFANSLSGGTVAAKMLQLLEAVWAAAATPIPTPAAASLPAQSYPAAAPAVADAASLADMDIAPPAASPSQGDAFAALALRSSSPLFATNQYAAPTAAANDRPAAPAVANSVATTPTLAAALPLIAAACSSPANNEAKRRRLNSTNPSNNMERSSGDTNNRNNDASSSSSSANTCSINTDTYSSSADSKANNATSSCSNSSTNLGSSSSTLFSSSRGPVDSCGSTVTRSNSCSNVNNRRHIPHHSTGGANNGSSDTTTSGGRDSDQGSTGQISHSCSGGGRTHTEGVNDEAVTVYSLDSNPKMPLVCNNSSICSRCEPNGERKTHTCTSCCSTSATARQQKCLPCCSCRRFGKTTSFDSCLSSNTSSHSTRSRSRNSCDRSSTPRLCRMNTKAIQSSIAEYSSSGNSTASAGSSCNGATGSTGSTSTRGQHEETATDTSSPLLQEQTDRASLNVQAGQTVSITAVLVHDSNVTNAKNKHSHTGSDANDAFCGRGHSIEKEGSGEAPGVRGTDQPGSAVAGGDAKGTEVRAGTSDLMATKETKKKGEIVADTANIVGYEGLSQMCQASRGANAAQLQVTRSFSGTVRDSLAVAAPEKSYAPIPCPPSRSKGVAGDILGRKAVLAADVGTTGLNTAVVTRCEEETAAARDTEYTTPPAAESRRGDATTGGGAVGTNITESRLADARIPAVPAGRVDADADTKRAGQQEGSPALTTTASRGEASIQVNAATPAGTTNPLCAQRGDQQNNCSCTCEEGCGCLRHSAGAAATCSYQDFTCSHHNSEPSLHAAEEAQATNTGDFFHGRVASTAAAAAANVCDRSSRCCDVLPIRVHGAVLGRTAVRRAEQRKGALRLLHLSLSEAAAVDDDDEEYDW